MGRINSYNLIVVLFVALGSFTYGFNSSIVASFTALPSFYAYFNLSSTGPRADYTTQMVGAMNSLFAAGGLIGALLLGWLANQVGRRMSIQIICVISLAATIISAVSMNMGMFLFGRAFQGFSAGMIDAVCPLYHSEVSPANSRGKLVGFHAFLLVSGYAGASWVGLGCYFAPNPDIQWRLCVALQAVAPLILLFGSPWIPESPRWLVLYGRFDEGRETLRKLHKSDDDPAGTLAEQEYQTICTRVELDRAKALTWKSVLTNKSIMRRLAIGFFVVFAAQSSGVLVVNNYQITLYEGLGITGWKSLLLLSVYTSWAAFMNWVNAMLLDRFGRIKLMTFGLVGAAVAISGEAAMVATFAGSNNAIGNGFGVFFLFLFITLFAGGMDACNSEIFPTWLRAPGLAISVTGLFTATLIYTGSASVAFGSVGWRYYLGQPQMNLIRDISKLTGSITVFIFMPIACAGVIWFYLPETNGRTLEEIERLFDNEEIDAVPVDQLPSINDGITIVGRIRSKNSV
ncbi:general substrate transporter [Penicillium hordei]|uniref:General substrate transporter n=1 Tax=Penicillium hordei TaxID=40994 RepID=A0AAD6H8B6_9EURO|nr:general substrate transporter [Penicillium hordei]KAJ5616502.1 general substrate transporter [Penicillium hordei]